MFNLRRSKKPAAAAVSREEKTELPKQARRSFSMADPSRLFADWAGSPDDFHNLLSGNLALMRRRARDLAENDPTVIRFNRLMETNIIGPFGIQLTPRPHDAQGNLDKADAKVLRRNWMRWGVFGSPTMCKSYDWRGVKARALKDFLVNGEAILRHVVTSRNAWGYALAFMDPAQLDHTLNREPSPGVNRIRMGVEIDEWEAPVAYWFHDGPLPGMGKHMRIPANEIIHWFIKERSGQTRGVTWLAPVGARKKLLDGYEIAAVVAARTAASKMGFFAYKGDEVAGGFDYKGSESGALIQDVAPGQFEELPPGYEFQDFDPSWPGAEYGDFDKSIKRSICAGLNVGYNTVAMDVESVSWSGLRKTELDDRDFYRVMQHMLATRIQGATYDKWLWYGLELGTIPGLPASKYEKFREVAHRPRGWQWVNPQQQQQSYKLALLNRTTSLTHLLAEEMGLTVEEYAEILAEEMETLGELHPLYSLKDSDLTTPQQDLTNEDPPKN